MSSKPALHLPALEDMLLFKLQLVEFSGLVKFNDALVFNFELLILRILKELYYLTFRVSIFEVAYERFDLAITA